jgi:hypothetical protein
MKTSKIVKLLGSKEWQSSYGPMFTIGVELENGDKGGINAKKADAYKLNDEINYTIEQAKNKKTGEVLEGKFDIKVIKEQKPFQKGGFQKDNEFQLVSFSYAYAKDLVVADKASIDKMQDLADRIADRMMAKYKSLKGDAGTNS